MNEPPIPGLLLAAVIAAGAVALLCWWFVWRYSRVNWQRTAEGRHIMRLTILLGLQYTLTVVFFFAPLSFMSRAVVSLLLFGATGAEMWTRNVLLTDAQREDVRD